MFYIVVVVHARILYGTNAQETKITLFGDGGDKLWAISGRRMQWQKRNGARTPSYAHVFVSARQNERTLTTTYACMAAPPESHQNWQC